MSEVVRKFIAAGFPNEIVAGEVYINPALARPAMEMYTVTTNMGSVPLKLAIRLREVPIPKPGVSGVKIQIENPIVEFLPSDAKEIAQVIKPGSINTDLAHWVVNLTKEEFDTFLKSIKAPTSLFEAPPGMQVPH